MATWAQLSFQESASPMMEQMINFHDHTMMILLVITVMVGYIMISMFWNKQTNRNLLDGQKIETAWTILPVFVLIMIAMPSFSVMFMLFSTNMLIMAMLSYYLYAPLSTANSTKTTYHNIMNWKW